MKRFFVFLFPLLFSLFVLPYKAFAHCPLCVAATGALVASTRVAGIDDAITGTFIGAMMISMALWSDKFIKKKFRKSLPAQPYLLSIVFIIATLLSFSISGLMSAALLFGIDRLMFGLIFGSILSLASFEFHSALRKTNGNKNHLPLQGIVLPITVLVAVDVSLYLAGVFV